MKIIREKRIKAVSGPVFPLRGVPGSPNIILMIGAQRDDKPQNTGLPYHCEGLNNSQTSIPQARQLSMRAETYNKSTILLFSQLVQKVYGSDSILSNLKEDFQGLLQCFTKGLLFYQNTCLSNYSNNSTFKITSKEVAISKNTFSNLTHYYIGSHNVIT